MCICIVTSLLLLHGSHIVRCYKGALSFSIPLEYAAKLLLEIAVQ